MERYTYQIVAQGVGKLLGVITPGLTHLANSCVTYIPQTLTVPSVHLVFSSLVSLHFIQVCKSCGHTLSELVFGYSPDYSPAILRHWRRHGIYYYLPFRDTHTSTISLFPYRIPSVRQSIWQLKFKNQRHYSVLYGRLLGEILIDLLSELGPTHNFTNPLLLTVPSHSRTIRKRGYQVTHLLAEQAMDKGLDQWVDYQAIALKKIKHTKRQSHITDKNQRLKNPRDAFRVMYPQRIQGNNIILLDDVYTTGATLDECTRILRRAGAKRVLRITIAH